jgi:hypothetical protein
MDKYQQILDQVLRANSNIDKKDISRVLIVYQPKEFYIGDTCLRLDYLKVCRYFFNKAVIDICLDPNASFARPCYDLLMNNPYLDHILLREWSRMEFESYDVVICAVPDEKLILEALHCRFASLSTEDLPETAVFSLSDIFVRKERSGDNIFPDYAKLRASAADFPGTKLNELFIPEEEKKRADEWLSGKGLKKNESVLVFLDSSSRREKLLDINVYFEVLESVLQNDNVRVLIFDEANIGKEDFYRQWLGDQLASRLIFANRSDLRTDISLLSSGSIKMIFGPCTGLVHCASAIYNFFVRTGMRMEDVPAIITYTGQYPHNENASVWWGNSPLVTCLLLKQHESAKKLCVLDELQEEERTNTRNVLPCKEYTASMLIRFIKQKLNIDAVSYA